MMTLVYLVKKSGELLYIKENTVLMTWDSDVTIVILTQFSLCVML